MKFVDLDTVKKFGVIAILVIIIAGSFAFKTGSTGYSGYYRSLLANFFTEQEILLDKINAAHFPADKDAIAAEIEKTRLKLKNIDFWLRYLEPVKYKLVNGPLAVEWENEVFEKFEKPYKREGAGLYLAEQELAKPDPDKQILINFISKSLTAKDTYEADSITRQLDTFDHFFLCNRMYLLNLAALYTTGFECGDSRNTITELQSMMSGVKSIYTAYNTTFTATPLPAEYLQLYEHAIDFVAKQNKDLKQFDHYVFIKDYVNPLFAINQKLIVKYGVVSKSYNDYTLNDNCTSIFDKSLYSPQNTKGIYSLVQDEKALLEIKEVGKKLFYDPILSGNNERSCVSCHKPLEYFTDTSVATSLQFNGKDRLPRNTPSLINVTYNHLLMLDGKHISLQAQGRDVMMNPKEVGGNEKEVLENVMSCKEYNTAFKKFLKLTPEEHEVTLEHIISAITYYYGQYSNYYSPFDEAMNDNRSLDHDAIAGFNLFMGKARCGTCHYVPQFNGVPPPYVSSEFEIIGVPADVKYTALSTDRGRYMINPADETMNAFRVNTVRNADYTKPYMHNGVFNTLDEVIDFYNAGGGAGNKLTVINQTLSSDSLRLTTQEKKELISFIHSLDEKVIFEAPPASLPGSGNKALNNRKVGGSY